MRYVKTHRLTKEALDLPLGLSLEQTIIYLVLFFPFSHIVFIFTANKLISYIGGIGLLFVVHKFSQTLIEMIPFYKIASYWNFIVSADQYVIKNEKVVLPHLVDLETKETHNARPVSILSTESA
jgi:hypothetical protein